MKILVKNLNSVNKHELYYTSILLKKDKKNHGVTSY